MAMKQLRRFKHPRGTVLACALGVAAFAQPTSGQQWVNPGTGSWFDALNWNPATVPAAGGSVLISNGGTATLTGIPATPLLGSLIIGTAAQGNGRGTVQSVGTAILVSGGVEVGTLFSGGSFAQGALSISGAGGQAGQMLVGSMGSNTVAASVSGQVSSAGAFTVNNGIVAVGQMFEAARGSTANGSLSIGGNAGTVNGLWIVGNVTSGDPAHVGSQSTGSFSVLNGGDLALVGGSGTFIGTTVGVDRIADAGVPGGFRVNQAHGQANVTGTLSVTGAPGFTGIGVTQGGIVDGALTVGALAMGANSFSSLSIGTSGVGGQAQASFSAGSGDLRNAGFMAVGNTTGGAAQGSVTLGGGGKLLGNDGGGLSIGTGSASAGELVSAIGSVNAAGGVSGFTGYNVGTLFGTIAADSVAQGSLVGGAAAGASSTGSIQVAVLSNTTGTASASGTMTVGNALTVNSSIIVGDTFEAARGSTTDGSLSIGGNAGTVNGIWIVGNVTTGDPAHVGIQSTGAFNVLNGGNLALAGGVGTFIGTTVGVDRVADAGAPGGFRVNQAQGHTNITGTLSVTGAPGFFGIGQTTGGIVDGSLAVGTLAMGANTFNSLNIGTSSSGGEAQGNFSAGSGDLRAGFMAVGNTTGGTAQGSVTLGGGGKLLGNNGGGLNVGTGSSSAGELVSAIGSVNAAGGVSGFTGYNVGTLFGTIAAGSVAQGSLVGGAAAGASSTGSIQVAVLSNTTGTASASGTMTVGNALTVNSSIIVGDTFEAGRGSTTDGSLSIGGNAGTVNGIWIVGNVTTGDPAHVGIQSTGAFNVLNGGNLALAGGVGTFIGTTVGVDRVADAGAPGGFRVNQAQGHTNITGTLSVTGAPGFFGIGQTTGGIVDGSLAVGTLAMGANSLSSLSIGTSGVGGQAQGSLAIGGGTLRVGDLRLGTTTGGSALGQLALHDAALAADSVEAGIGAGATAELSLVDASANIIGDLTLLSGELSLQRSLVSVGGLLTFGDDAELQVGIDGLLRGTEYGAIDAMLAILSGMLTVDFSSLAFTTDTMVFDLLRSGSADGISGDFGTLAFIGLAPGYVATAGVELDSVEVYRVHVARISVPEPGTCVLFGIALAGLAFSRRRQ